MEDRIRSARDATAIAVPLACALMVAALAAGGCASIPGDTGQEQAITIEQLEQKTLADLERQEPRTKDEIAASYGYVIMSNKLTKIPLVGVGAGYGVGVHRVTGARTYLRMRRFDLGFGVGVRAIRPVMIFQDSTKFRKFVDGDIDLKLGAEASAKVGDSGAAGGGTSGTPARDTGYTSYLLTDSGVSATASLALIRVKTVKLKKG